MGVTYIHPDKDGNYPDAWDNAPKKSSPPKKKKIGHTKAQAPAIDLDQPGRLRVAHLLALLGISHSTFYAGRKSGRYPEPTGMDGNMPWWSTESVRHLFK
jgi:predicted DNA-binding transcriptional regulator AlpA